MTTKFMIAVIMGVMALCSLGCMGGGGLDLPPAEMSAEQWAKLETGMTIEEVLKIAPKTSTRFDGEGTATLVYETSDNRYQVIFSQGELEMKEIQEN